MSRLDDLPLDQRAALSVLLGQRKTYAEVATMLGIAERSVRDRAHAALAVLAPSLARPLTADERAAIGDYLLDQRAGGVAEHMRTRELLATSEPARAWAQALAAELGPLGTTAELPPPAADARAAAAATGAATAAPAAGAQTPPATGIGPAPVAPTPAAAAATASAAAPRDPFGQPRSPAPRVSRTGGAVLLGLVAAGAIVGILFAVGVLGGGGSSKHASKSGASKTSTGPKIEARLPLTDPSGSKSRAGLVEILAEGGKRAFYAAAEGLPASQGFFYALWLTNPSGSSLPLGKAPAVKSNGHLEGGGLLPETAGQYKEILLTRETSTSATHPGPVVLRGPFSLSG